LAFQESLIAFTLNLGVLTNSERLPLWPSRTANELCREKPKATEKNVKNKRIYSRKCSKPFP
jgi:hypothetical protein